VCVCACVCTGQLEHDALGRGAADGHIEPAVATWGEKINKAVRRQREQGSEGREQEAESREQQKVSAVLQRGRGEGAHRGGGGAGGTNDRLHDCNCEDGGECMGNVGAYTTRAREL
jgi:hypothetical protein